MKEAQRLFQADCDRQPYVPACDRLVVSPETSRQHLATSSPAARRQLCIYDPDISDPRMVRVLAERLQAGVDLRIIGKATPRLASAALRCPAHRLHVRAIIRDGAKAFLGSQSLRTLELDKRREIGLFVHETPVVKRIAAVFEQDWAAIEAGRKTAEAAKDAEAKRAVAPVELTDDVA